MMLKLLYELTLQAGSKGLAGRSLSLRASARSQGTTYGTYDNYNGSGLSVPALARTAGHLEFLLPSQKCHKAEIARCTSFDQWMGDCF
jgi:hypothetical protein